jgi:hypothetical protein
MVGIQTTSNTPASTHPLCQSTQAGVPHQQPQLSEDGQRRSNQLLNAPQPPQPPPHAHAISASGKRKKSAKKTPGAKHEPKAKPVGQRSGGRKDDDQMDGIIDLTTVGEIMEDMVSQLLGGLPLQPDQDFALENTCRRTFHSEQQC